MTTYTAEQLSTFEEIRQLKARYSYFLDTKQWDAWAQLFTADFRWATENGLSVEGRDAFVEMVRSSIDAVATVHQFHAPVLEILSPTTATGLWPMFDYVAFGETPIQGYGYYHETYRREDDGWRMSTQFLSRIRTDVIGGLTSGIQTSISDLAIARDATAALPGLAT
ncbi:nuclear transport factor 2 family protein [Blastococcus sp. URHD0036]|uniref:nuclear transport factor 2 family protein n=1 Tax=Blastococcus sp. URHD0036 TaxID=1380356 RepID=UPI0018CC6BE7|nr:nuclear transport factor 2 family protein [Blastococcus sp. URHD0036]